MSSLRLQIERLFYYNVAKHSHFIYNFQCTNPQIRPIMCPQTICPIKKTIESRQKLAKTTTAFEQYVKQSLRNSMQIKFQKLIYGVYILNIEDNEI